MHRMAMDRAVKMHRLSLLQPTAQKRKEHKRERDEREHSCPLRGRAGVHIFRADRGGGSLTGKSDATGGSLRVP